MCFIFHFAIIIFTGTTLVSAVTSRITFKLDPVSFSLGIRVCCFKPHLWSGQECVSAPSRLLRKALTLKP